MMTVTVMKDQLGRGLLCNVQSREMCLLIIPRTPFALSLLSMQMMYVFV